MERITNAGTVTSVDASATATPMLARNTQARLRAVYNDSSADLYLKYGPGASATSFTVKIGPGGYFEFPAPLYAGTVTGAWSSATGAARVTEA